MHKKFLLTGLVLIFTFIQVNLIFADDTPLGANVTVVPKLQTTFAIWSPDTSNVQLWLNGKTYSNPTPELNWNGEGPDATVYAWPIPGNCNLEPYHFIVNGISVHDPYAKMIDLDYSQQGYEDNDIVIDSSQVPPTKVPSPSFSKRTDAIIYEMHIRDFTISPDSGTDQDLKGTYAGMVEPGTTCDGYSTGIDHLKKLGITHIQIMPMYEFGSCSIDKVIQHAQQQPSDPPLYNWGYDPTNYNVPEWRYSQYNIPTSQYNNAKLPDPNHLHYLDRIREVQMMIDKFHEAGIRVIMDVVYNHTLEDAHVFDHITNKYYTGTDLTGCSNTLDPSEPMVSQMILDSLEYWVNKYHVDGFRFDLMGAFPYIYVRHWVQQLNKKFPDRKLIILGEPWSATSNYKSGLHEWDYVRAGTISLLGISNDGSSYEPLAACFNPSFIKTLRGDNKDAGGGGYIFDQRNPQYYYWSTMPVTQGSRGGIRYVSTHTDNPQSLKKLSNLWDPMFANEPSEDINHACCHDDLCLWDKIKVWAGLPPESDGTPYLRQIDMFAYGIIFTSQGIPFFLGGAEMLRTKNEDSNSDSAPDSENEIQWSRLAKYNNVFKYYQKMITMRRAHPAFRMPSWDDINQYVNTSSPSDGILVTKINGAAVGDTWSNIIVIYNPAPVTSAHTGDYDYTIPESNNWKVYTDVRDTSQPTYNPNTKTEYNAGETVVAGEASVTVLYQESSSKQSTGNL